MTEVVVSGAASGDFDFKSARAALSSSSTTTRIQQLQVIDERISQNGVSQWVGVAGTEASC